MAFHGPYQAGILPAPQQQTSVIAFNATAEGRGELTELMRALTSRARFLTTGGPAGPGRHRGAAVRLRHARARTSCPTG